MLSYLNIPRLIDNEALVVHTHKVLDALRDTMTTLTTAETGQRGYIITGEPARRCARASLRGTRKGRKRPRIHPRGPRSRGDDPDPRVDRRDGEGTCSGRTIRSKIACSSGRPSDALLTFSRVTTKAQPLIPVDLNLVAREVISDLDARIRQTGGIVERGALPTVEADPLQMRQLLQNLIGNALKFRRPDARPWYGSRQRRTPARQAPLATDHAARLP